MNGKPAYHLTKITPDDFTHYLSLAGNAAAKIIGKEFSETEARQGFDSLLQNNALHEAFGSFKITDLETGVFIGVGKLEVRKKDAPVAELGYMLLPEHGGESTEDTLVKQLIAMAKRQWQLQKLIAIVDPGYEPSRKILTGNGFVAEELRTISGLPGEVLGLHIAFPYFIWISGPINAGKSTVAKHLAGKIHYAVNIETDALSDACPLDIDEQLDFIIEDALALAMNWINRGFIPVINGPLYGKEADYMMERARRTGLHPLLINLTPALSRVLVNRGNRELDDWERRRIAYMYEQKINEPAHGYRIDNGEQTVAQTVEHILQVMAWSNWYD